MIMNLPDKLRIGIPVRLDCKGEYFVQRVMGHSCVKERGQTDISDTGQNSCS